MREWYFYLHSNGSVIGKNPVVVDSDKEYFNSDFVKKTWKVDLDDDESCRKALSEANEIRRSMGLDPLNLLK